MLTKIYNKSIIFLVTKTPKNTRNYSLKIKKVFLE